MLESARLTLQLAVGLVLLISAIAKLRAPRAFAQGVADYRLLPYRVSLVAGVLIIPAELAIAMAHLTGYAIKLAVPCGLVLLVIFLVAVSINLMRARNIPCHCFGTDDTESISVRVLVRLFMMIAGEVFVLLGLGHSNRGVSAPIQFVSIAGFCLRLAAVLSCILITMWVLSSPELIGLFHALGMGSSNKL